MSRESIRARVAAATEGPWVEHGRDVDHDKLLARGIDPPDAAGLGCEVEGPVRPMLRGDYGSHHDADFIAHARQDVPLLLAVADAAAASLARCVACIENPVAWDAERGYCAEHENVGPALAALEKAP